MNAFKTVLDGDGQKQEDLLMAPMICNRLVASHTEDKWTDLRTISQVQRSRLAEGLEVEGVSEKKEGNKEDSYLSGMSN